MDHVTVIGIGPGGREGVPEAHLSAILKADLLIASRAHLDLFPDFSGETLAITANMPEVHAACRDALDRRSVVVLGSGDPNFFGVGRYLIAKLGADRVRIHPAPSFMQLAFARVGLPWHDAALGSVHGKPLENAAALARCHSRVGLFTDPDHTPAAIARHLLEAGFSGLTGHVCARLGMDDESVSSGRLEEIARGEYPEPNILILEHGTPPRRAFRFGLPEDDFVHRKPKAGLITRREIRALALSKLALAEDSVVWDIGAGSGSVAVECALLASKGRVFAVEKNAEDLDNVRANVAAFEVPHVTPVHARAPQGLDDLPDPDAVFVGGSGGELEELLATCLARLRPGGRLVMTLATLDNLARAMAFFKSRELPVEITHVQVSRGVPILDMTRLEAQNPVTLLAVDKPAPQRPRAAD